MGAAAGFRSTLSRVLTVARAVVGLPTQMLSRRRILGQLGGLDDRMLRDIGLTRGDVASAGAEPLFRDPSLFLVTRVRERRYAAHAAARERLALAELMRQWQATDRAA